MSTVSIIMPVYNVQEYLDCSIESVLEQTHKDIELIIVNDGSTDNSRVICEEYAAKDNRIKLIHQENAGLPHARNVGLSMATGDFICFIDSDDFIKPNMIEALLAKLNSTKADIVECSYYEYHTVNDCRAINRRYEVINGTNNIINRNLTAAVSVLVWNKMYRRDVITQPFVENENYEDILFTANVLCNCARIACVQEPLYYWRQRRGSISRSGFNKSRLLAVDHFIKRAQLYKEHNANQGLINENITVEIALEMAAVWQSKDKTQIKAELKRAEDILKVFQPSVCDIVFRIHPLREKLRTMFYLYKCLKYKRVFKTLMREK